MKPEFANGVLCMCTSTLVMSLNSGVGTAISMHTLNWATLKPTVGLDLVIPFLATFHHD